MHNAGYNRSPRHETPGAWFRRWKHDTYRHRPHSPSKLLIPPVGRTRVAGLQVRMRWPGRFLHIVPSPFRPAIAAMRTAPCTGPPMVIPVRRPLPAASNPDITGTSPIPDSRNPDKTDTRRHWNGLIQRGGRCHIHINLSNRTCNTARRINHTAPNQSQRQHGCSATSAQQGATGPTGNSWRAGK